MFTVVYLYSNYIDRHKNKYILWEKQAVPEIHQDKRAEFFIEK